MTKKDRMARCREIIDSNQTGSNFPATDLHEFIDLIGADERGVVSIQRRENPKYPSDTRHLYASPRTMQTRMGE